MFPKEKDRGIYLAFAAVGVVVGRICGTGLVSVGAGQMAGRQ